MENSRVTDILYKAFVLNRNKKQIPEKAYHTEEDKLADQLQEAICRLPPIEQINVIDIFRKILIQESL